LKLNDAPVIAWLLWPCVFTRENDMKTNGSHASNINGSRANPASDRGRGVTELTERELAMVAAAGGPGGLNPRGRPPLVIPR
jgi:hypothetical protein